MKHRQEKVLTLLDQRGGDLYRLLGRLTRCEHTARDLMQELFIRLSGSRGFDKALNPYAYAWKTAVNLAFSQRRRKRMACDPIETVRLSDESVPKALDQMIREEQLQQVLTVTATFSELARNVIVMRFIEQQTYDQMAERLGKNPDYLRALCSKTLKQLRDKLNQQFNDARTEVSYE